MAKKTALQVSVGGLLSARRILVLNENIDKNAVLGRLCAALSADLPQITGNDLLERVLQREQGISTTLDTGLSIPHVRLAEIPDFLAALAVLPEGIADPAQPGISIKVMFLFVSPTDPKFFQKHLQLLSVLAALFQPAFIESLSAAGTPEQILQRICAGNKGG